MNHDLFSMASSKAVEYSIAIGYLLLFIPFWRYSQGMATAAQPVRAAARQVAGDVVEWFNLARDVAFHPGHAWARLEGATAALIGADDFAQKLVGPIRRIDLPAVGTELHQGTTAWRMHVDGKEIDMVSPVTGVVTAINREAAEHPTLVKADPYHQGWLLKVEGPHVGATGKGLLRGDLARRWIEQATDALRLRMTPDLGLALQDGGVPVDGLASAIDHEHWDEIAREHLLS
jgi:glycine cleavage system H lipoate-binding protein